MADLLHLELVTPEKSVFADDVKMVVAPAAEGDVGILPHHTAMMAMLRAGIIMVHQADGVMSEYYADGGYVSIANNRCIILAEAVIAKSALNEQMLREQIAELKQQILHEKCDDAQLERLQKRVIEAENAILFIN